LATDPATVVPSSSVLVEPLKTRIVEPNTKFEPKIVTD
jgi:hypothetical protein